MKKTKKKTGKTTTAKKAIERRKVKQGKVSLVPVCAPTTPPPVHPGDLVEVCNTKHTHSETIDLWKNVDIDDMSDASVAKEVSIGSHALVLAIDSSQRVETVGGSGKPRTVHQAWLLCEGSMGWLECDHMKRLG